MLSDCIFQGHNLFITLAITIRVIEAIGNAAFMTASFAIIAKEFPDNVGTTFVRIHCRFLLYFVIIILMLMF